MIDLLNVEKAIIENVKEESPDVKTLVLKSAKPVCFEPGQFILLSRVGIGESPFAISSNCADYSSIEVSVQKVGKHTSAIHELDKGDAIWFRGPYGNSFPTRQWKGKKIVIVAGGIGMAPLRALLYDLLSHAREYKDIQLLYGARSYERIIYKDEIDKWKEKIPVHIIVEQAGVETGVRIGLVTQLIKEMQFDPADSIVVICGPRNMIGACSSAVSQKGVQRHQIFISLEMKMKCGVGICGRCNIDHRFICKDGPVFRMDEVEFREL